MSSAEGEVVVGDTGAAAVAVLDSVVQPSAPPVGPRTAAELALLQEQGIAPVLRKWLREVPPKVDTPAGVFVSSP